MPSEVMDKEDPRFWASKYGESFIRVRRLFRGLTYPLAAIILLGSWWIAQYTSNLVIGVGVIVCIMLVPVLRTHAARIQWTFDYRPPILVLRSHTDFRTKEGDELPALEMGPSKGNEPYLFQLSHALWEWGRVVLLLQEFSTFQQPVHGVVLVCSDKNWTETMLNVARQAWVVLIFPSSTAGCIEEMRLLARNDLLVKTVVFMPPTKSEGFKLFQRLMTGHRSSKSSKQRISWSLLATELLTHGFKLPEYDEQGMLYVPNNSFGVAMSIRLNREPWSWHRISELVSCSAAGPDHLWKILNNGRAFEAEDKKQELGGMDAKHHGIKPGSVVAHTENGTVHHQEVIRISRAEFTNKPGGSQTRTPE